MENPDASKQAYELILAGLDKKLNRKGYLIALERQTDGYYFILFNIFLKR